ncbi:hypothetical protein RE9416_49020 (plasmid) [Prescottella equi]|nr:hypothetical protein RE9416_49020 [Prescottella equi]BCN56622.1 hypothetical protein RE9425_50120 [Prescottella equi]BCN61536.1 hypothetical protein RE9427_49060 [Prescottella equi]BCN86339.1 hypothetical protein RE0356_49800 [Prescottella equi]
MRPALRSAGTSLFSALGNAASLVRAGRARHVLVIGVERLLDLLDTSDQTGPDRAFIFADGGGAVVVGKGAEAERPYIRMNGQAVFRWAVTFLEEACRAALDKAGVTADDLDAFVPHQANSRITDALIRTLGLPDTVAVARDIVETGNTSAASIPMAMEQPLRSSGAKPGDTALLLGFGAGLAYAGQVVQLPAIVSE